MNKLIAFSALAGLLAVGCASQNNSQGGSDDSKATAQYSTFDGSGTSGTNGINSAPGPTIDSTTNSNINSTDSTLPPKSQNP